MEKVKVPNLEILNSTYQVKDHHTVSVMQEPNLTDLLYLAKSIESVFFSMNQIIFLEAHYFTPLRSFLFEAQASY